ncbi:iron chelate uptake ABC transporter family permease subunit [soil metagenome]
MSALVSSVRARGRARHARVILALAGVSVVVAGISLAVGSYTVSVPDLVATLTGHGSSKDDFIVLQLRLPRVALGALVGLAFAVSGAIFQALLANPLASPDIIGITGGASAAAVAALLLGGASGFVVSASAFLGALIVAASIALLALRSGLNGYRFVLIGIGFAFIVRAILGYLLTRSDVREAHAALVWLVGSLGGASWQEIAVTAVCLAVLAPALVVLASRLRMLQLGDETAAGLGVGVTVSRVLLIGVAVGFAAVATAAAGPVAFVPFVAAPIARRLVGAGAPALVASALVGIVVVLVSDFIGQHLLPDGLQVPVGIVTGIIGTPLLIWLLVRSNRR